MRIQIRFEPGAHRIPFNYQPQLTGAVHKWLGENTLHNQLSLYSFSWIQGLRKVGEKLMSNTDCYFEFAAHDPMILQQLINGMQQQPQAIWGLEVREVAILSPQRMEEGAQVFRVQSPVLVRGGEDFNRHLVYSDPASTDALTRTFHRKLAAAGLPVEGAAMRFDAHYPSAKTKLVEYRNVHNRANMCPVIVGGSAVQKQLAYDCGAGGSTGVGFGMLV